VKKNKSEMQGSLQVVSVMARQSSEFWGGVWRWDSGISIWFKICEATGWGACTRTFASHMAV